MWQRGRRDKKRGGGAVWHSINIVAEHRYRGIDTEGCRTDGETRNCSSYADAKLTEYFVSRGSNERGHEWAENTAPRDTPVYCMHVNDTAALYSVYRSGAASSGLILARRLLIFSACAANVSNERIVRGLIHDINFWTSQHWEILIQNNTKDSSV